MTALLLRLFIPKNADPRDVRTRRRYGNLSGGTGIVCNALLCLLKVAAGLLTGAMALVADGLNNLSDMGSSLVTVIGFRLAAKPPDRDHPYGHGRMEYMSALLVAVLILAVGLELFKSALKALISGDPAPRYTVFAAAALAVSIAVKLWMFFFNRTLAKKISSEVLTATARDSLSDVAASTAILLSAAAAWLLPIPFNLDAVMALGVALFILWSGFQTARDTVNELLGKPPEQALVEEIKRTVLSFQDFLGLHDLIVHSYGPGRQFASVHVEVECGVDLAACHEQIDICEKLVQERTGVELVIHMDPIDTHNETVARVRGEIAGALSEIDPRLTLHDFRMTPCGQTRTNLIFDVVVPAGLKKSESELREEIAACARAVDPTYCCVITFDQDFTGR